MIGLIRQSQGTDYNDEESREQVLDRTRGCLVQYIKQVLPALHCAVTAPELEAFVAIEAIFLRYLDQFLLVEECSLESKVELSPSQRRPF